MVSKSEGVLMELMRDIRVDLDARDWRGRGIEEVARCGHKLKLFLEMCLILIFSFFAELWVSLWGRRWWQSFAKRGHGGEVLLHLKSKSGDNWLKSLLSHLRVKFSGKLLKRVRLVKKRIMDTDRSQRPKRLDKITNVLTLIRFLQTLSRKVAALSRLAISTPDPTDVSLVFLRFSVIPLRRSLKRSARRSWRR